MITKDHLHQVSEFVWEISPAFRADMRVPARLYADATLLEDALEDKSVEQLVNTATLPGIVKYAIAMPDIHQGYGAPVGGVFATEVPDGVISPGAVGYDINCLSGDARILNQFGYYRTIAEMQSSWRGDRIVCQEFSYRHATSTAIRRFL